MPTFGLRLVIPVSMRFAPTSDIDVDAMAWDGERLGWGLLRRDRPLPGAERN